MRLLGYVAGLSVFLSFFADRARAETLELYIDADFSRAVGAAESIELGVRAALSEVGYQAGGITLSLVPRDHRGNAKRSFRTMQAFVESDTALAMIGGKQSPPYITNRDFMNENGILTLLPWSAAGPLTRAADGMENWIFRLSVDDVQAGPFLVRKAVEIFGCESVALVLLDSGWGRANRASLESALEERGLSATNVVMFPNAIGRAGALKIASDLESHNASCAILLSGHENGGIIARALYERVPSIRVLSHWGILGGTFAENVPHTMRESLQVTILQTCGLRRERAGSDVLSRALQYSGADYKSLSDVAAPTGFVHGYDLTKVLIAAVQQAAQEAGWLAAPIAKKRAMVRAALAELQTPVEGILKTYDPPFEPYGPTAPNGHEALGLNDLCMARFGVDGRLEDAS